MQRRASAQVDRAPGLPRWRGARRVLQSPSHALAPRKSLNVVALSVLLLLLLPDPGDSKVISLLERIQMQIAAPELTVLRHKSEWCPPGFHVSEGGRNCTKCSDGEAYTTDWNDMASCIPCRICKEDEEEKRPCTLTRDRECQCKAGTFLERDSPEFCRKCSTSCPDGMVQNRPCTPWSDLKCVSKGSRTKGTKDTISAKELVATSMATPISSSVPRNLALWMGIPVVILVLLGAVILLCCCGVVSKIKNSVSLWLHSRRGPGACGKNQALSNRESQIPLNSGLEREGQESVGARGVMNQITVEAQPLQRHPNAEVPEMRRMLLVPVNGTDPTETLKRHFDYFITVVPFLSWKAVMRKVGLTDNDICMAAAHTVCPDEEIYVMLVRWLQKTGKGASVNTLLDALEAVGERNAKEMIQNHLVGSGEYTYKENLLCEHV